MDELRFPDESPYSPVCRAFLTKLARTPDKAKRQKIVEACAKVLRPWAEELLWELLADPNECVRAAVVRGLSERPRPLHAAWAARRLSRPPWFARSSALTIIGRRRLKEALPGIDAATGDPNVDVRRAAAEALGEIGGNEAVRLLVRLRKDTNPYVRAAAEEAIGKTSGVRFS
jgi:HEAT repeat protein